MIAITLVLGSIIGALFIMVLSTIIWLTIVGLVSIITPLVAKKGWPIIVVMWLDMLTMFMSIVVVSLLTGLVAGAATAQVFMWVPFLLVGMTVAAIGLGAMIKNHATLLGVFQRKKSFLLHSVYCFFCPRSLS